MVNFNKTRLECKKTNRVEIDTKEKLNIFLLTLHPFLGAEMISNENK